jgi:hypothetical protein
MKYRIGGFLVLLLAIPAGTVDAHHNMSALFDFNDRVTVTGTLSNFDWRNPHIYLEVVSKDDKETVKWSLEGPAPGFFRDRDVSKADFEASMGKPVTAEASRARDGSKSGLLRTMTLPSGKVVSACPQNC